MAADTMRRGRIVRVTVGCLFVALCAQLVLSFSSAASADDGEPPVAPTNCVADRVPLQSTATITWSHDGVNTDKFVVEKSKNGGDWFWDGAPLAPVTEHLATELAELDEFRFRVRAKALDGTVSDDALCADEVNVAPLRQTVIDPTALLQHPTDVLGVGLGMNWLLDSDLARPRTRTNVEAINDLGAGILRFPFGHLSDNYLWNIAPWGPDLQPRIASQYEDPGLLIPGSRDWSWGVSPDDTFIDAMDFDEFMDVSAQTGTASLVVVNAAAHTYQDGPTYEELRETAVEWVRYAMENNVAVDYWQIGNEADHPADGSLTSALYIALYLDFSAAMRAVDPTISIGPGLIGLSPYSDEVIAAIQADIDFAGAHQYLQYEDHSDWRLDDGEWTTTVEKVQQLVDASNAPDTPILVTETNSIGGRWLNNDTITTTKALALFEMLMRHRELPNVAGSLLWTTHTPWSGETFIGDDANMFFNDDQNALTPSGMAAQLFAQTVNPQLLASPEPEGNVHIWPSVDEAGSVTVHLLNKGTFDQEIRVGVDNGLVSHVGERIVFAGLSPDDPLPTRATDTSFTVEEGAVTTIVPANGIAVLEIDFVEMPPTIVINEIHYNPAGEAAEFVELHSLEAEATDLSGFVIDGLITLPPDTTIDPGGFLVLTDDLLAFNADHPNVPAIEWTDGEDLNDDGEILELLTPEGLTVDVVDYR